MIRNIPAFTLIEVLISLAVLSISMLSIYSLIQTSLDTTAYAKEKMFVIEKGYDRVIRQINYPTKAFSDTEEYDGVTITYKFEKKTTQIPLIEEIHMTVSSPKASIKYIYYTQEGKL